MGIAVGIDLGTTNSCVAVVQAQRARVVEDATGKRIQPSVISFHPGGATLAGLKAKDRLVIDPKNTIYSFKRLLGRKISSAEMQHITKEFPYSVSEGPDGIPVIQARGQELSLPEVSAIMLKYLREMCTKTLGVDIDEVVITVPANFNDVQRSSTKVAARIAGFNVLRILNEPTAAALAYGFGGKLTEKIAVYDFGGGTFDITIIELMDDIFEVLSTAGETFLGGDDFDEKIVEEMRRQFLFMHRYDLGEDPVAMQRVRTVAERIKCQLSNLDEVEATLREIAYGPGGVAIDFSFKITRAKFESMIESLVDRSIATCQESLKLAKLDVSSLDNLILVGGSTRIPLVRKKVKEFFNREPRTEINPDEVVAIGAAIHAFSLTGEELPEDLPVPVEPRDNADFADLMEPVHKSAPMATPKEARPAPPPVDSTQKLPQIQKTIMGLPTPLKSDEPSLEDLSVDLPEVRPQAPPAIPKKPAPPAPPVIAMEPDSPAPPVIAMEPDPPAPPVIAMEPDPPAPPIDLVAGEDRILPKDEKESFSIPMVSAAAASTLLLDVTPRGLGVATAGGYCDQIIERNAAIPVEQSRLFSTSTDNQTEVAINIFQGESRRVEQNTLLGQVQLSGIRPAPRGEVKIKVIFEIDTDGILGVSAVNEETGAAQDTRIQLLGGLNEDQVNALVSKYSKS